MLGQIGVNPLEVAAAAGEAFDDGDRNFLWAEQSLPPARATNVMDADTARGRAVVVAPRPADAADGVAAVDRARPYQGPDGKLRETLEHPAGLDAMLLLGSGEGLGEQPRDNS